jgi:hypothetical protein
LFCIKQGALRHMPRAASPRHHRSYFLSQSELKQLTDAAVVCRASLARLLVRARITEGHSGAASIEYTMGDLDGLLAIAARTQVRH